MCPQVQQSLSSVLLTRRKREISRMDKAKMTLDEIQVCYAGMHTRITYMNTHTMRLEPTRYASVHSREILQSILLPSLLKYCFACSEPDKCLHEACLMCLIKYSNVLELFAAKLARVCMYVFRKGCHAAYTCQCAQMPNRRYGI
jgi:hypothetical protein